MKNHKFIKHDPDCKIENCIICVLGVCHCTVCEGTESSLTSDCVGKALTDQQQIMVSNDALDFKNGKWARL